MTIDVSLGVKLIEVVDLVWKGLRQVLQGPLPCEPHQLKSLTWFGRDCDTFAPLWLFTRTAH